MTDIMVKTTIYRFNDLDTDAKNRALNEEIKFIIEYVDLERLDDNYAVYPNLKKAYDECEKMKTPWFLGQYIYEYSGQFIQTTLQDLYYFKKNGVVFGTKEDVDTEYGLK